MLFKFSSVVRKAIYTTNAAGSLDSVIFEAIKRRKVFPSYESAKKVVYPAIEQA
jgi:putative transposase